VSIGAGIGKSTLFEAAAVAASQGMTVAAGRADELDQISPWSTLVQAFSSTQPPILDRTALESTPGRLDQRGAVLDAFRDSLESVAMRARADGSAADDERKVREPIAPAHRQSGSNRSPKSETVRNDRKGAQWVQTVTTAIFAQAN
jgi:hypothetical protein